MSSSLVYYFRQDFPPLSLPISLATFLLQEPEEDLGRIVSELETFDGYLSEGNRRVILATAIAESERRKSYETLLNIAHSFADDSSSIDKILSSLKQSHSPASEEDSPTLGPDQLSELRRRLELIFRLFPGLQRQKKAERLSAATGLSVESIDLICDLRPVFTNDRSKVEGLIPFTTLKVVASDVDRFPKSFEVVLSARDVQRLYDVAQKAVDKLNALGNFASEARLTVPLVDLTKPSE